MKVHSDLSTFKAKHPVVTIGMFDGVHTGHRQLLAQLVEKAKLLNGEAVVITFWPHPRMVLNQDKENLRFLTSPEERTILFSQLGIDHLLLIPFTKELANHTSEEFVKQFLVDKIGIHHLLMGYNHRFGKDRESRFEKYIELAEKYNFGISRVEAVETAGLKTSSTDIRNHLLHGDIQKANQILGYHYLLSGRVMGGQQLGRRIGYPTANIEVNESFKLIPPDGVYACSVHVEGKKYGGMLNIGFRPTVNHNVDHRSLEVHIFDFNRDIYSEEIQVEFLQRVRNEMKFENVEALIEQLKRDEQSIRLIVDKLDID
nr:bifunctional riboflavin kinase/FAD synthetase [uncultured Carboxylicivirga sp.]